MLPDRVSNPGPPTYESGVLPIAQRGPAFIMGSLFKGMSLSKFADAQADLFFLVLTVMT